MRKLVRFESTPLLVRTSSMLSDAMATMREEAILSTRKKHKQALIGKPKKDTEKENYTTRWIADQQLMGWGINPTPNRAFCCTTSYWTTGSTRAIHRRLFHFFNAGMHETPTWQIVIFNSHREYNFNHRLCRVIHKEATIPIETKQSGGNIFKPIKLSIRRSTYQEKPSVTQQVTDPVENTEEVQY